MQYFGNDLNDPHNPVAPHRTVADPFVYSSVPTKIWELPQYGDFSSCDDYKLPKQPKAKYAPPQTKAEYAPTAAEETRKRRELNTPQVDNDLNDPYNPVAPHAGYKRERFVYASVPSRIWEMPQYSAATTTKQLSLEPQTSVAVDVATKKAQAVKDYAELVQEMQNYAAAVREDAVGAQREAVAYETRKRREMPAQVDNDFNDPYNPVAPHAGYKREPFVYGAVPSQIWQMPQYPMRGD